MCVKKILVFLLIISSFYLSACSTKIDKEEKIVEENSFEEIIDLSEKEGNFEIYKGGTYVLSGNLNGQLSIKSDSKVTLIFDNITIENSNGPAIYMDADDVIIELKENSINNIVDGITYLDTEMKGSIYSKENLTIIGNGELNISSNYKHALKAENLNIEGGSFNINSKGDGINVSDSFELQNGNLFITAEDDGIQSDLNIFIKDGNIQINAQGNGIISEDSLVIDNGNIDVLNATEGLESKNKIVINNGIISIETIDDGINSINSLVINGGEIFVDSKNNDAIDSNGSLEIYGGYIEALGSMMPEGGIDVDMNKVKFEKGTLIASGGTNSFIESLSQYVLLVGSVKEGNILNILDKEENKIIFSYNIQKDASNVSICIPEIESKKSYLLQITDLEDLEFITGDKYIIEAGGINQIMGGFGGKRPQKDFNLENLTEEERKKMEEEFSKMRENMPEMNGDFHKEGQMNNKDFLENENLNTEFVGEVPNIEKPYFEGEIPPEPKEIIIE